MAGVTPNVAAPTIAEIVDHCLAVHTGEGLRDYLVSELVEREEAIAVFLRDQSVTWVLFPEVVAEMFSLVGLGEPISEQQRAFVHQQYLALIERLQAENEGNH